MAYADALPLDLLRSEQDRISREMRSATTDQAEAQATEKDMLQTYLQAVRLLQRGPKVYSQAPDESRRQLNQAFIATIRVDADTETVELTQPWLDISEAARYLRENPAPVITRASVQRHRSRTTKNPGRVFADQGSNINLLVEVRGLEPLASSVRGRRSTRLSYTPRKA